MSFNTYIPGTTVYMPFDPGNLDLTKIQSIVFAFADHNRNCVAKKYYPQDTATTADGVILVPLSQEDTALLPKGGIAQAQINFKDKSVSKTLETILKYNNTINTDFISNNAPALWMYNAVEWNAIDFGQQIINISVTTDYDDTNLRNLITSETNRAKSAETAEKNRAMAAETSLSENITAKFGKCVIFTEDQDLTVTQKTKARDNIGASEQIKDASGNQYRFGIENGLLYIEKV